MSWYEPVTSPIENAHVHDNLVYGVLIDYGRRQDHRLYRCVRVKSWKQGMPYGGQVTLEAADLTVYPLMFRKAVKKFRANKAMVPEGYTEWEARGCTCNCCPHIRGTT